jgi:Domain of unknown function (DUF4145)
VPISARLAEMTRFKWKDIEVEFEKKIKEIEQQADKVLPAVREIEASDTLAVNVGEDITVDDAVSVEEARFSRLAELSPPAAIIQAWLTIEEALKSLAVRHDIPVSTRLSSSEIIKLLAQRNILDAPTVAILNGLRVLRNEAAHAQASQLNFSQAKEYHALTRRLVTAFMQL